MTEINEEDIDHEATTEGVEETHAEVAQESENPVAAVAGQFGVDAPTFVAQLINFLIVLAVLWAFVYRPVVKMLDERKEKIEASMKKVEEIDARMTSVEAERDDILKTARKEAQEIAEQAHEAGTSRREEMLVSAKEEVRGVVEKAKKQLADERASMLVELRADIVDITVKAVESILVDQVDEKASQKLAKEMVEKLT
jgi:F-type H+-transporting ATPase subunit b